MFAKSKRTNSVKLEKVNLSVEHPRGSFTNKQGVNKKLKSYKDVCRASLKSCLSYLKSSLMKRKA